MASSGQFIDVLLTSGLALVSSVLIMVVRWVMRVVAERDRLADDALTNKIMQRLDPRFKRIETQLTSLQLKVDRNG